MGVLINYTFIVKCFSLIKKVSCYSEVDCSFMSTFTWPKTDLWRWVVASFVVFWPYSSCFYCTIRSVFSGWICHGSFHLTVFSFDSPGHMLLWTEMFFGREQSSVRSTCVLRSWIKEGDYSKIYINVLSCSFRHCQSIRSYIPCNFLHLILCRLIYGWCKWGSRIF